MAVTDPTAISERGRMTRAQWTILSLSGDVAQALASSAVCAFDRWPWAVSISPSVA
jgi:hypothetical protein